MEKLNDISTKELINELIKRSKTNSNIEIKNNSVNSITFKYYYNYDL